ncbi:MAG TPA: hypothetical protein VEI97_02140 [bacterium]|nr:hypothetical protein [bacterium]
MPRLAADLNPLVLAALALVALVYLATYLLKSLSFQDTTVEAVDRAPDTIDPTELRQLIAHGDRANALLKELRGMAITHHEADPNVDALSPAVVFHLANEQPGKPTFDQFTAEFEGFLRLTRKYKLALDNKTQRGIQKIYFAWDPGGNAIQVKTGDRLWNVDVKPGVTKLLEAHGGAPIAA